MSPDGPVGDAPDDDVADPRGAAEPVDRAGDDCSCKVGRSARESGLDDLDARLQRRHSDGASLRELERFVNEAVLEHALRDAGTTVVGDVGSVFDTLVGEDASAGERTELRTRLSNAGVDVAAVESDLVSYQTVRRHLRECLDVDTDRESPLSLDDGRGTVEWARSRCEGIVERTLERLASAGAVTAGDLDVTHTVRVTCPECGYSGSVEAFLDDEGCTCASESR